MQSLFDNERAAGSPLPARMRPYNWDGFVGQTSLREKLERQPIHSMILYGPPGCGKTTLAGILARNAGMPFHNLSAVSAGVKDVRVIIEAGRERFRNQGGGVVLFLDEIHRFSKNQQDAMLEAVEAGWITLIGATTENPSFEVVGPLLSRCQVYRLLMLESEELNALLDRALADQMLPGNFRLADDARELLLEAAAGDARRILSALEMAAGICQARLARGRGGDSENEAAKQAANETKGETQTDDHTISREDALQALEGRVRNYDKGGENHYDYISAFIKSLRGSDPDAALLYMACMLEGGEDPLFIARRMIIFAAEDVGNASPQATSIATAAYQAVERIGLPEGRIVLAQAATFLAASPKSNAAYAGINAAQAAVRNRTIAVPNHLRNAPTKTHRDEGAGLGYLYPHDFPGHFARQEYLPENFGRAQFYFPSDEGQETRLKDRLRSLWPGRKYGSQHSGQQEESS
ncbi:MAG: replication-associated recombination protein A [bacterium]|nr:replication-associated recombination protein A [bacterium]